jgi:stage II sporulation protein AA (anti-sigma F factor antagonist)
VAVSKKKPKVSKKTRKVKKPGPEELVETTLKIDRLDDPSSTAIVTLSGYLQRPESKSILQAVDGLVAEGVTKVIFDMTEVRYANSSAIGAFVNSASTLKAHGGLVVLLKMQSNIEKVFKTLGLLGLFTTVKTKKTALKAKP